jgi:hypothetical protein
MGDEKAKRTVLPVYDDGYTTIPAFFIDELMPYANGIPASVWKYMMVLWRDVFGINCEAKGYVAEKVMTQFHVSKETAMQWTAALSVSGVFSVFYGIRHRPNEPGIPTKITYYKDSTVEEWKCFIVALRDTVLASKRQNFKTQRDGVQGFRIALSFAVDKERQRIGLHRCYDDWHNRLLAAGELKKLDNGGFEWQQPKTKRSGLMTKEEKDFLDTQYEEILGVGYKDRL